MIYTSMRIMDENDDHTTTDETASSPTAPQTGAEGVATRIEDLPAPDGAAVMAT